MRTLVAAALALCVVQAAAGQLTYVSGVQTNSADIMLSYLGSSGVETLTDFYSESAPGLGSWTPAPLLIEFAQAGAIARVRSTYASTLSAGQLSWRSQTLDADAGSGVGTSAAAFNYDKAFDVTFQIAAPTTVLLSAALERNNGGWHAPDRSTPFSLVFGPVGGPAIVSLVFDGNAPTEWSAAFPLTEVTLQPGEYRVTGLNHNDWSASLHGASLESDDMRFDLVVIPAPGAAAVLGLGLLSALRRRR